MVGVALHVSRAARARDRRRRGVDSGAHPHPRRRIPSPFLARLGASRVPPDPRRLVTIRATPPPVPRPPFSPRVHQVGGDYAFSSTRSTTISSSAKAQLARCLVAAERCPDDPEAIPALAFDAHSMKGAASLRAGDLVRVCELLERIAKRLPDQHESDATPRALVADVAAKIRALAADAAELRRILTFPVAHAATRTRRSARDEARRARPRRRARVSTLRRGSRGDGDGTITRETTRESDPRVASLKLTDAFLRNPRASTKPRRRPRETTFLRRSRRRGRCATRRETPRRRARANSRSPRASCGARFATPPRRVGASTL